MIEHLPSYLFLSFVCLVPPAISFWLRRDLLDPRLLLVLYWFNYTAQLISVWQYGGMWKYVHEHNVPYVLYCAGVAAGMFYLAASLTVRGSARPRQQQRLALAWASPGHAFARDLSIAVTAVATCGLLWYAFSMGEEGFSKVSIGELDTASLLAYRRLTGLVLLFSVLTVSIDSRLVHTGTDRRRLVLALLASQEVWGWLMSEREVIIPLFLYAAMYKGTGTRRYRYAALVLAVSTAYLIEYSRSDQYYGESLNVAAIREKLTESPLPTLSASLSTFTNVADIIPSQIPYFSGKTYLYSLATLLPGDPFEVSDKTGALWYAAHYYGQGNTGLDFAIDTEAYMNFSWLGPPAVFLVLGMFLGWFYKRCRITEFAAYAYPLVYFVALASLRTDSRSTLKMWLGSAIVALLLLQVGREAARLRRRSAGHRGARAGSAPEQTGR